jgi:xanthine dehydrogenase YagS FAD-binding subunit
LSPRSKNGWRDEAEYPQDGPVREFGYEKPARVEAALAAAGTPGSMYLGGGTNLVDLMKLGVESPRLLVDVTALPCDRIEPTASGGVRIGATVRNSDLAGDLSVRRRYPVLAQAVLAGASGQLRNMATVGGNLMQRTRCTYFADVTKPCNKRAPGTGCPALVGEHHNHAILGASQQCVATNPSDMAVALVALGAIVHVQGSDGAAAVGIEDFYRLPGDEPDRDTTLAPGALITAVELPPLAAAANSRYRKARERASYAFAIGSVGAVLEVHEGVITTVRLGLGAAAPVPWRAHRAEAALLGGPATEAAFAAAAAAELAAARPLRDNGYKVRLLTNMIIQVLAGLAGPAAEVS